MKYLHTMVRVTDIEASLRFYRDALGMEVLSRRDHEGGRYTLVFLVRARRHQRADRAHLQLARCQGKAEQYGGGRNFGHVAYAVDDIYATCRRLMEHGVTINRPPRDGRMAFVRSPDNISIELLQAGAALAPAEPWTSMPNVGSLVTMYLPKHFEQTDRDALAALMRERPLATLITATADGPSADLIPLEFIADEGEHGTLRGHVARANPLWQRAGTPALAVFSGPEAYISPGWYASKARARQGGADLELHHGAGPRRAARGRRRAVAACPRRPPHRPPRSRAAQPWAVSDAPRRLRAADAARHRRHRDPTDLARRQMEGQPEPQRRRSRRDCRGLVRAQP